MDCFASLAMTKGGREVIMDCFASLAMTKKRTVIARVRRTRGNLVILDLSLRGFEKAVAISVWDTLTVKQNSSLRELLLQ